MDYSKLSKIENFIFDVDGVLTNCRMLITEEGEFLRTMNVRDGSAMKKALNAGFRICIITKGSSIGVKERLILLGADPVYDKVSDKRIALQDLVEKHNVSLENSLYMGDDLADLVVFDRVLLATCPRDAAPEVIKAAEFISPKDGGDGCVRDIIERVLRTQGKWGHTD